ncbi:hypothetical protein [Litorihabitans aurantiacus]|uniref:Uncharacterized protein n=1 Tax=Litorihabitans aurantiacus TaxID=1930061 RepID=A0AA37XFR0_9MICO|nr:hypothetical protein [Litorihabitans aurantiacus]GMA32227.1 hypothetical protein GCM10025875_22190 [Litorihabitans aurantiacus]
MLTAGSTIVGRGAPGIAVAVAVVVAAVAASCSGPAAPQPFAVHAPGPVVADAEISGVLQLTDGCLTVGGYPLSLVESAVWDARGGFLTLEGEDHAVGSEVSWGGAYSDASAVANLPAGCTGEEVATVHAVGP